MAIQNPKRLISIDEYHRMLLLAEIADSSVGYDRGVKAPLYAVEGIREYWILDLAGEALEVYRRPSPGGYRDVRRLRRGEEISPEAFPEVAFPVSDLLGPAICSLPGRSA